MLRINDDAVNRTVSSHDLLTCTVGSNMQDPGDRRLKTAALQRNQLGAS